MVVIGVTSRLLCLLAEARVNGVGSVERLLEVGDRMLKLRHRGY